MGDEDLLPQGTQSEGLGSYSIIEFRASDLFFGKHQYRNLIFSKWLRSLRHGNEYFKLIDPPAYYEAYGIYINRILNNPQAWIRLAVITEDPDVVLGFCVFRETVLDYVHVLRIRIKTEKGFDITDYRRRGIGSKLIPKGIETFTHLTRTWLTIWGSKYGHWKFNPFA